MFLMQKYIDKKLHSTDNALLSSNIQIFLIFFRDHPSHVKRFVAKILLFGLDFILPALVSMLKGFVPSFLRLSCEAILINQSVLRITMSVVDCTVWPSDGLVALDSDTVSHATSSEYS